MIKALTKRHTFPGMIGLIAGILTFLPGMYWYTWSASPLTPEEIESYLETISTQKQVAGREHDLVALRRFLMEDDGLPFYTVNLYRFYEQAAYATDFGYGGSGRDAFDRFSTVMLRLLAARASHPIFGSDWVFEDGNPWDRLVIVRYRSRRDLVDIFASSEFESAAVHKWAGLRDNGRLLVQALHIPAAYLPAMLISLLIMLITTISVRAATRGNKANSIGANDIAIGARET